MLDDYRENDYDYVGSKVNRTPRIERMPQGYIGALGKLHPVERDVAVIIFKRFGDGNFTCETVHKIKNLSDFNCQTFRSWRGDDIVEIVKLSRQHSLKGKTKTGNTWRFTSYALRSFMLMGLYE
jgi:hypothetical protein